MTDDKLDLIGLSLKEISETLINKDLIQAKEKLDPNNFGIGFILEVKLILTK